MSGPTTVMRNLSLGLEASREVLAIPPKMKSVIPSILIPLERDTKEWASSWVKRNEKNRPVPTAPLISYSLLLNWGALARRTAAVKVARMRKKRMNQEWSRERSQIPQLTPAVCREKLLPVTRVWAEVWEEK